MYTLWALPVSCMPCELLLVDSALFPSPLHAASGVTMMNSGLGSLWVETGDG